MNRHNLREMTINRIMSALLRRVKDLPDVIAWSFPPGDFKKNIPNLDEFHNMHASKRCFILANGPSLSKMDLSPLSGEITFGMNRIYLLFDKIKFVPTYYVCINELVLEQFAGEISSLPMHKFLNWNMRRLFSSDDAATHFVRLSLGLRDKFVGDPHLPLTSGGTVTYVALQIAFYMGFSSVILVGLDHSFSDKGIPNKVETRQSETDTNHFHPDYFPKGSKWQLPDLQRSEIAYQLARDTYERNRRVILDATTGGKCPVFQRVEYESLF